MQHQLDHRLTLALATARVKLFELDDAGRVTWVSEPSIGLLQGAPLPAGLASLPLAVDRHFVNERVRSALTGQNPVEFEMRVMASDRTIHWFKITLSPEDRVGAHIMLGVAVDITKIKERDEGNFWLTQELMHGSRNLLSILQAITTHSSRERGASEEFRRRFIERLHAISIVHDLLFKAGYVCVDLAELVTSMTVEEQAGLQIRISGDPTSINPGAAEALGLALHELFRNARLHGALRSPSGVVDISWTLSGEHYAEHLELIWRECGGPPPLPGPAGFGTFLIANNLPRSLNGNVAMNYLDQGLSCNMKFPFERMLAYEGHDKSSAHQSNVHR